MVDTPPNGIRTLDHTIANSPQNEVLSNGLKIIDVETAALVPRGTGNDLGLLIKPAKGEATALAAITACSDIAKTCKIARLYARTRVFRNTCIRAKPGYDRVERIDKGINHRLDHRWVHPVYAIRAAMV